MYDIREDVRRFILAEVLRGEPPESLQDDTPLLSGGLVDSVSLLQLVRFIEQQFGIEIELNEAIESNLDDINRINTYVTKLKQQPPAVALE